jgi:heme O synthase-like polyprenyltransferase
LSGILSQVYLIAGIVAVIMLVWAGIQYITSTGDPGKAKTARQNIVYSLTGLAVIICAYAITNFVTSNVNATTSPSALAANITSIGFLAVGILSVLVIIISGIRYVTSAGDPGRAKSARQTLTYALIGTMVAVFAYAIVSYLVGKIGG